ncbi:Hypothetical protein SRAE_1000292300 [Strongyloides ratti]|uniref:Uncharacterized protein n=1 Tax=Strongyloides ratti TaxID=34506 RepID=A0A090LAY1_STRRB|nr:Hypothetical protein SRAE_1000292300 [Strongyloides ratti]CEF64670.1 Hypothetical protein SRAE_1000292300 [Strongyloides ratti]
MSKFSIFLQIVFVILIFESVKFSLQKPLFSSGNIILSLNGEEIQDEIRNGDLNEGKEVILIKRSIPAAIIFHRLPTDDDNDEDDDDDIDNDNRKAPIIKRAFDRVDSGYFGLGAKKRKRSFDRVDSGYFGLYKKAFDRVDSGYFGLKRK